MKTLYISVLFFGLLLLLGDSSAAKAVHRGLNSYLHRKGLDLSSSDNELWFENLQDHFNPFNTATYQQRYFMNDTFYQKNGPVFILLGGEGALSDHYVNGHFMVNTWAEEAGAMIFALEHRYFGKSVPTKDLSTENLKFLSSQQGLADAANFVASMKEKMGSTGDWVVFGGSYPGCLSAFFRLKYPQLVVGSVASSAPVFAELDFVEYQEVVGRSIGSEAAASVKSAFEKVDGLLSSSQGRQQLQEIFNLCDPIKTDPLDIAQFVSSLSDPIDGTVQYNNAIPGALTIEDIQNLMKSSSDPLLAFVNLTKAFSPPGCIQFQSYADYVNDLQRIAIEPGNDVGRCWTFMTCTEFGFYQTFDGSSQPFGKYLTLDFFNQICDDAFGAQYKLRPHIDWTNDYYGGRQLSGTKITLPNGSIDPWHALGILKDVSPTVKAEFITGTSHCFDMYAARDDDPPALTEARQHIKADIWSWLGLM